MLSCFDRVPLWLKTGAQKCSASSKSWSNFADGMAPKAPPSSTEEKRGQALTKDLWQHGLSETEVQGRFFLKKILWHECSDVCRYKPHLLRFVLDKMLSV